MRLKKLFAILLALAMVFAMAACGDSSKDDGNKDSQQSQSGQDGEPSAQPDDTDPGENNDDSNTDAAYTVGICQLVQHPALDAATQGFRDALEEKLGGAVKFDEQNASNDSANCVLICNGFVSSGYDLILANATPALLAAQTATNEIPVLGTSITDYASALEISDWNGTVGGNISGTSDLAPLDGQAEMLHELFPDAEKVGILYCSGEPNSAYQANTITPYLEGYGYTVSTYTFADSNDVSAVTDTACRECDVLYIPTDNTAASCTEAINNVALNAKTPIIAGEEGICSGCGVATLSISYYDIGYATGEMAYEILANGADISTMPIQYAPQFTKKYNSAVCDALGITVSGDYIAIGE